MIIIANPVHILKSVVDNMQTTFDFQSKVYDPTLDYETIITGVRRLNTMFNVTQTETFPILAYSRSPMRRSELGHRGVRKTVLDLQNFDPQLPSGKKYVGVFGEFDVHFLGVFQEFTDLENFEFLYNGEFMPKRVKVDLSSLGLSEFGYDIVWSKFDKVQSNLDKAFYKTVGGSAVVSGWFLADAEAQQKLIRDIDLKIELY